MESLFFHPKVVHIPIALAVIMPLLSGVIVLAWWRNWLPQSAWALAIGLQCILVGSGFVAMNTGEEHEEIVECVVDHGLIHEHEEAAELFVYAAAGLLVPFLAAGLVRKRKVSLPLGLLSTLGTLAILFLGYQTGEAGGSLVYEHGAANAFVHELPDDCGAHYFPIQVYLVSPTADARSARTYPTHRNRSEY
ncbi:MAG: hypothetical protein KC561_14125 [Myxococcales bacterium]|nr:hypothetical protein [Myxococcales bacterium]